MKVVVGGTFDLLHDGHKALLRKAFDVSGSDGLVIIGLSSDEFVIGRKSHHVNIYSERKRELEKWLNGNFSTSYVIQKLDNCCGSAHHDYFDAIVVGYDTLDGGLFINKVRACLKLYPLQIILFYAVKSADGEIISSTALRKVLNR